MSQESLEARVLHLSQVEKLSIRQMARILGIGRRRIKRILDGSGAKAVAKTFLLEPYRRLIIEWYQTYPRLMAKQVYERLLAYGYTASYRSVVEFTSVYRRRKPEVYHLLSFLPGEEAQVDWFFFNHPVVGKVAGFLYVLAYSRYAWGKFYPRTTFEFFLAGHLECFQHLRGLARRHRYDNLKSVVLSRKDSTIQYNPQFLDFARFFGFSIHACNPYSGNEKGRVERPIRDARAFLYGQDFTDIDDLNDQFRGWLVKRSHQVHRSTGKTPYELLGEERLLGLPSAMTASPPSGSYPPTRTIPAVGISKTALVEFDANHYSVPTSCVGQIAEIIAWPEKIEILVSSQKVAVHPRSFGKKQLIRNPLHAQKLLERSGHFKFERILQLIQAMDPAFDHFLWAIKEEFEKLQAAYELFQLLRIYSRTILVSAVEELNGIGSFKIKALRSLLNLPSPKEGDPLWPANLDLLKLSYAQRSLKDYDPTD
jgi:transposase